MTNAKGIHSFMDTSPGYLQIYDYQYMSYNPARHPQDQRILCSTQVRGRFKSGKLFMIY
jgi:hypothetical protein